MAVSAAEVTYERSGSRCWPRGVGTQIRMALQSRRPVASVVATRCPEASRGARDSEVTSSMYEWPALMAATLPAEVSTPTTARPASAKATARGSPT